MAPELHDSLKAKSGDLERLTRLPWCPAKAWEAGALVVWECGRAECRGFMQVFSRFPGPCRSCEVGTHASAEYHVYGSLKATLLAKNPEWKAGRVFRTVTDRL